MNDTTILQGKTTEKGEVLRMTKSQVGKNYKIVINDNIREGVVPPSGRIHHTFKEFPETDYSIFFPGGRVNVKDVKHTQTIAPFIVCPDCGRESEGLIGFRVEKLDDPEYKDDFGKLNKEEARKYAIDGVFYCCPRCHHVFQRTSDGNFMEKYIIKKTVDALICPRCVEIITKTPENFSGTGYVCYRCMAVLEWKDYPHHGTCDTEVVAYTDYFGGVCPECKGAMYLGDVIWVEDDGKVVLPLECCKCGNRDAIKIITLSRERPQIRNEWKPL